jgi:cysteine desulfurase
MTDQPLYLDHASTTPVRPEVAVAMRPYLGERYGNPSSSHAAGRAARAALEGARERVAASLGASPSEIVFTGGGSEADNLAVLGRWRATGGGVALSAIEHSAVRRSAAAAAREGASVTTLAVDEDGRLDEGALAESLEGPLAVVSVMWGNHEIGVIQPVDRIAEACRARDVVFHTDAVQAVGHVPVSVEAVPLDLLALSAHKFGGPTGMGALFVREGVALQPLVHGGGQERGLRAGTSNVAGAVGLAEALELANGELEAETRRLGALRDRIQAALVALPATRVNGAGADRLPHVLSVAVAGVDPDVLVPSLDLAGLAVSSGSACHSGASTPSHVLLAIGAAEDATIRISLGWTTTEEEVDAAIRRLVEVIERVRAVPA